MSDEGSLFFSYFRKHKNFTMKKILLPVILILFVSQNLAAQVYDFQNITLLDRYDDTTFTANNWVNSKYAGCWGWYNAVDGREYGIIGGNDGTYIVEVTNPTNIELRDYVPGRVNDCVWREYKTYQNYLYMVSDDGGPNGLQIADLSYLPDSVHIVHNGSSIITTSHTIWIDGNKLYCGSVNGAATGGYSTMAVFSLANPASPTLLRKLGQDYPAAGTVHDMFVRNDTVWASHGYDGFYVYKFNANNTFTQIGSLTSYPDQGYNHSSSLTSNGQVSIMMDEVPNELAIKVLDVSSPSNIQVITTFRSSLGDTPHNPFVIGNNYVVCANYQDGIQIYDISNPASPVNAGYFDTHYQSAIGNTGFGYVGCWGAYPYLPSGKLLASDMQNGLYVLNASAALGIGSNPGPSNNVEIYYSGYDDNITCVISSITKDDLNIEVMDVTGRLVYFDVFTVSGGNNHKVYIPARELAKGAYVVSVSGNNVKATKKIGKIR